VSTQLKMNVKKVLFSWILCLIAGVTSAQTLSAIEIKSEEIGSSKLKKAPKKLYISEFRVNYQILHTAEDQERGSYNPALGYAKGSAKVVLGLGINNVTNQDLINNTDHVYEAFVNKLKNAGYEILNADAAAGISEYDGWERKKGGTLNEAQFKGFISSTPNGYDYFVKKTKTDGKEKGTFTDNSAKVSFQMKNVTVVRVNLFIPIAENAESWASAAFLQDVVAKVVLGTNLTLDNSSSVVSFINSEAMSLPTSMHTYWLKKPIEIDGVLEEKKYKLATLQDVSTMPSSGLYGVFEVDDIFMQKIIPLDVDPAKYNEGVRKACDGYLDVAANSFISKTKKK